MADKRKRFEDFSADEIKEKWLATIPKATTKCNLKWQRVLREYLAEKGFTSTEYWCYPDDDFDAILSKFWFEVRTQRPPLTAEEMIDARENKLDLHPELYTIASLRNLRNGLSHCMAIRGREIDLTTDPRYTKSQNAFQDACKELKKVGKGAVKNFPEIEHSGL